MKEKSLNNNYINGQKLQITNAKIVEEPKIDEQGLYTIIEKRGKKYITTFKKNVKISYGDIVTISGEYRNINSYKNHGISNYKESLKKNNINGKIIVERFEISGITHNTYGIFVKINNNIKNRFEKNYSHEVSTFLEALVLGDKDNLDNSIKINVQENGLSHILAISGMHINIIILLLKKVLDLALNDSRKKKIILIIALILFNCTIGFICSATRAVIMSIFAIIATLCYRKSNIWINISLASLIILIVSPYYLMDSGFLLSFGATIGIVYLYPKLKNKKNKNKFINHIYDIFLVTLSVNLFTFPITIFLFKKVSISFFITRNCLNSTSIYFRNHGNNKHIYSSILTENIKSNFNYIS